MTEAVSVIIPAYNAAPHIERAVESVRTQTCPPLEILVVDDGSRDRTAEIVDAMPPPVRLIRKANGGPASARNLGARSAKGDWLAFLDADDWWFPDKLRLQLACADDPGVGLIHCLPDHRKDVVPERLTFEMLWDRNWIINSSVLVRRSVFEELGGFNEAPELISVEDYNLWLRVAASSWTVRTCPRVLVHYTRGIGISSNSDRFMAASLYNLRDVGERLNLPPDMVRQKQNEVSFDFGRRALFERNLPRARKLFRKLLLDAPSPVVAAYLALSMLPRPALDIRRRLARRDERRRNGEPRQASGVDDAETGTDRPWQETPGAADSSILVTRDHRLVDEEALPQPVLIVSIDAEEGFDWSRPFSRTEIDVTAMRSQHIAHRIFERYGTIPTYMVDHPVASQDGGRAPLKELLQSGLCDIGAQLHPWVTPPFIEHVSARNSYAGNLPGALEFAKIQSLTQELESAFGITPRIFRAGRYGVGPNTAGILRYLGYQVDSSVVPCWSFTRQGGPDFRRMTAHPFWIDRDRTLLELPVSAAIVGRLSGLPLSTISRIFHPRIENSGLPSIMAHLGLLERIKLTPEGIAIEEAKRLVRIMRSRGHRVFVLTYHSPSLEPGNTPYVQSERDLRHFLGWIEEFLAFFTEEIGGRCATWREVRDILLQSQQCGGAPQRQSAQPAL